MNNQPIELKKTFHLEKQNSLINFKTLLRFGKLSTKGKDVFLVF